VNIVLKAHQVEFVTRILERTQDAALRDETYNMDTWLACQDVLQQIDGQTVIAFQPQPAPTEEHEIA
jgi:hypothetical protein